MLHPGPPNNGVSRMGVTGGLVESGARPGVVTIPAAMAGALAIGLIAAFKATDGASIYTVNGWLSSVTAALGLGPLPMVGLLIAFALLAALASVGPWRPITAAGAAVRGAGIAAVLLVLAPSSPGAPLPSIALADADGVEGGYAVRLSVEFDGTPVDAETVGELITAGVLRGRVVNEATGEVYNLFRGQGATIAINENRLAIKARIPGETPSASLVARVEADGYRIVESRFSANQGVNRDWTLRLRPSGVPIVLQRLKRAEWF